MSGNKEYDYIIAGTGCAGLSLAMQLKRSQIDFKKVLLVDQEIKNKNDRTWCFWTKQKTNWFDDIVHRRWSKFEFRGQEANMVLELAPYEYMLVKGIDFYNYCLEELRTDNRFEFLADTIESINTTNNKAILKTANYAFAAKIIFNSAIRTHSKEAAHVNYVQHFKGYVIESDEEVFDSECPVFMDFSVHQKSDCRFVYLIPFSKKRALVEYTGFSKTGLTDEEYDEELKKYISDHLKLEDYKIIETEKGEIPMAESKFTNPFGSRVVNIGTAGGYSKASTGYTFYFIQKNTEKIIQQLLKDKNFVSPIDGEQRYKYYDKILLDVIDHKRMEPRKIFEILFSKNPTANLLAFLNEESSIKQDLSIMNSVPKLQFVTSAIKKMIK